VGGAKSGSLIQCSYFGINTDGTVASGTNNVSIGLRAFDTLVGGLNAGEGNVISKSTYAVMSYAGSTGSMIRGNFIGTDPTGMISHGNFAPISQYTGTSTWADITKNLISGNTGNGIQLTEGRSVSGSDGDIKIRGNYIGVDRTGNTALANGGDGINFPTGSVSGVTIGGVNLDDRNVISGNTDNGIYLGGVDVWPKCH